MREKAMRKDYSNILKATSLFGSVQGLNILINIVRTKLVAMLLGPAGVGLNSIYNETRELVHSTTNLGLDVSGIKNISQTYERLKGESSEELSKSQLRASQLSSDVCLLRSWIAILALFGAVITILFARPLSYLTFQDPDHTMGYIMLSPVVALSTLTCGEMTILKGIRRLKALATVSVLTAFTGMCVSVPVYYVMGIDGILPALGAIFLASLIVVTVFSWSYFPPRYDFAPVRLALGVPLLKVGTAFMTVNLIDNLIQLLVQSYLNGAGSLQTVGLFSTNLTITTTYAGIFFAALGNDYFPRLSGIFGDVTARINTVRRQSEMLMALVSPAIVVMMFALPIMVPLLFSGEFVGVIPLTQLALIALMFKTAHLPFTYTPLAAGDSKTFFVLNFIQASDVLLVIPGYHYGGLVGIGVMLIVTNAIDWLCSLVCAYRRYGVTMSKPSQLMMLGQMLLLVACYGCVQSLTGVAYWAVGAVMALLSMAISKRGLI
jgi:O-antigen/teichoic acid export membrane protein